ncbi:MAG TPA: ferritin-like domain-containing protein [Thermoanaerobaculia bacterium]|nr:ferritin-like domain-containing protein [Thermoanaerobaculia bacterium]
MNAQEFVERLREEMQELFAQLGETETLEAESHGQVDVVTLLELALQSELEASEIAALWMPTTPEMDAKQVLAHQVGDEMKHYDLIVKRLGELGKDLTGFDPLAGGYSAMYHYLRPLRGTVERIAAGPFAGEAIAEIRNVQFIAFCRSVGDEATARLYEEVIQPEEIHHHRIAAEFLARHCTTPALQETAAAAMRNTLAIADELQTLEKRRTGLPNVPVS